jgi:hypothetical protein
MILLFIIGIAYLAMDNAKNTLIDSEKKTYIQKLAKILEDYKKNNPNKSLAINSNGCVISTKMNYCKMDEVFNGITLPEDPNNYDYVYKSSNGIDFIIQAMSSVNKYYIYDSITKEYLLLSPSSIVNGVCGSDNGKILSAEPKQLCNSGNASNITKGDNTVLLMHMDGEDGGQVFSDQSGKETTVKGSIKTKTNIYKFGNASAYFDGASYLSLPSSDDWNFNSSDFTIDFWVYLNNLEGIQTFISRGDNDYSDLIIKKMESNALDVFIRSSSNNIIGRIQGGAITALEWHHIAYTRKGSDFYLFLDGKKIGIASDTNPALDNSNELRIGAHNNDSYKDFLNGYIDEFRILKGAAVYVDDFILANNKYYWYNWSCNKGNGGINDYCGADTH